MDKPLSDLQRRVYDTLAARPDEDVPIYVVYEAAFQVSVHTFSEGALVLGMPTRTMQMRLGSLVSRINNKLEKENGRIAPGEVKQTYRLYTKAD